MSTPAWVSTQSIVGTVATSVGFSNGSNGFSAGNCIVLAVASWWDSGSPGRPTVTDNHGNTYTWLAGGPNVALDGTRSDFFCSPPLAAGYSTGAYTVTAVANSANLTGTNELYGQLTEWSGFGAGGIAVDVSGFTTYGVAQSSVSVSLSGPTAQQAVEALVCIIHFNDDTNPDGIPTNPTGTGTWSNGGSVTDAFNNLAIGASSQVTSATGTTYTATWTGLNTSTNNGGTATIVALYPASVMANAAASITEGADTSAGGITLGPLLMANFADRVQETTTTAGTGTLTLGGAVAAYQSFATAFPTLTQVAYRLLDGNNWEVGYGTFTTGFLSRDYVVQSSNANALISLSGGSTSVVCTGLAQAFDWPTYATIVPAADILVIPAVRQLVMASDLTIQGSIIALGDIAIL
jgi:hypothetical protein